jgi:hypothetical protein
MLKFRLFIGEIIIEVDFIGDFKGEIKDLFAFYVFL